MRLFKHVFCALMAVGFFSSPCYATGVQFGITLPVIIKAKDPEGLHGYHALAWYQPESLIWPKFDIYFTAGFGHWWAHGSEAYRSLNIYAIAPVIRYYFTKTDYVDPYVEASIGPSYLTKTHFADRNLGMHFAFQDEIGVGMVVGKQKRLNVSLSALHYSNGSLCSMNAGITLPLMLNVGYKFG